MARIRTVKPEFWTDGTNLVMSDSCALFFIGLWNFCDDEGKHRFDLNQLVAELGGRWHRGKVRLFISCLVKSGQLRLNSDSTWMQVTGWSHQKIDKPKHPEIKSADLQWLSAVDSTKALETSRTIDASIGSYRRDRIGSDHSPAPPKESKPPRKAADPLNAKIWDAYLSAYVDRYKVEPVRNASVNSKISQLAKRLGEDAIDVVRFYLTHNDTFYVKGLHNIGLCLAHAEALNTQWLRGKAVTGTMARQFEQKTEAISQAEHFRRLAEEAENDEGTRA